MRVMLVSLLLAGAALAALPTASASELPVGCGSDGVGACVWQDTPNGDCVGVHFGLQGAGACADTDPANVRVCTSMRSVLYDGNCPTDGLTVLGTTTAAAPPSVLCNPDFAGVCVTTSSEAVCAGANVGLQGAGACVFPGPPVWVRACSSLYTAWGRCPTDALAPYISFP